MGSQVDNLEKDLKKAHAEIKKLVAQLKKGSDPKATAKVRELMVKYNDTNLAKAYDAAAKKDAQYTIKMFKEINPGF